jgi:hypothetical protein
LIRAIATYNGALERVGMVVTVAFLGAPVAHFRALQAMGVRSLAHHFNRLVAVGGAFLAELDAPFHARNTGALIGASAAFFGADRAHDNALDQFGTG